ncbi:flagellar motor protein MotB [Salipaludibacillus agaradhaerens]|uniref:Flagellar motor protein MotB n=1 Tax=Salipaludibacillus agaradhaerens TaxID=76935 RepID=A0A9Q4AZN6_SALAG|nr:flagellar motor protein MotS [Salipaludibacillus agaradhaerens]MCR6095495.1 flagellar motor protein MotB [Salipaludibacillus agaradhaerens]MCR6114945.1 flagellar motor protein MotB [Salipaludibacillus agaradhaerens]
MNRRRQNKDDKGAPKWMVTFSDMMTLILVFFILLFSMSVVDATKFRAIAESFQERAVFDFYPSIVPFENPAEDREVKDDPFEEEADPFETYLEMDEEEINEQLDSLLEEVVEYLEENELTEEITVSRDDRGVVLVLQEQALFETARADIISEAEPFLGKVGALLNEIPNMVKVEGHTDSRPISTAQFPSNWELSGARASSVIRFLIDESNLEAGRFLAIGYGDTRPVAPNTTPDNLQQNRRVVIVISDPTYSDNDLY